MLTLGSDDPNHLSCSKQVLLLKQCCLHGKKKFKVHGTNKQLPYNVLLYFQQTFLLHFKSNKAHAVDKDNKSLMHLKFEQRNYGQ